VAEKKFGLVLTLHKKLVFSFSLSSALIILVGIISYIFSSMKEVMIVTAAAVAVTMVSGFLIYRSITNPIDSIKARVNEIAMRNFEVEIAENTRDDELGELARSITQMKEHLKEKDRQKDEFINVASHELRTPIQPIVAYIELARKGVVPPTKAFEVISVEALRLKRLADDILDVSRIEGKRLNLKKEYFSINDLVAQLVESTRASTRTDAVTLTFRPNIHLEQKGKEQRTRSDNTGDDVFADKYRIIQVITNILNNAVKFTKQGSIEVTTNLLDNGSAIEISISDTGGGIPNEIFPRLFEKFATKGVAEGTQNGTGLGLFISQSIIKEHDGSIAGLNNDKGGATFRVILPTAKNMTKTQVSMNAMPETTQQLVTQRQQQPTDQIAQKVAPLQVATTKVSSSAAAASATSAPPVKS
jgi:signal transduction histidine kinase